MLLANCRGGNKWTGGKNPVTEKLAQIVTPPSQEKWRTSLTSAEQTEKANPMKLTNEQTELIVEALIMLSSECHNLSINPFVSQEQKDRIQKKKEQCYELIDNLEVEIPAIGEETLGVLKQFSCDVCGHYIVFPAAHDFEDYRKAFDEGHKDCGAER